VEEKEEERKRPLQGKGSDKGAKRGRVKREEGYESEEMKTIWHLRLRYKRAR
jgi:hypothetical protein